MSALPTNGSPRQGQDLHTREPDRSMLVPYQRERPLGAVFSEIWENTQTLVRHEITLATGEFERRTQDAKTQMTRVTASGAVLHTGFLVLVVALVLALWEVMPLWLSAFIVGVVLLGAGYLLLPRGQARTEPPRKERAR